jgi:hypothetical protein
MKPDIIRLPCNRQKAAIRVASTYQPNTSVDAVVGMIETEHEDREDEVLPGRR